MSELRQTPFTSKEMIDYENDNALNVIQAWGLYISDAKIAYSKLSLQDQKFMKDTFIAGYITSKLENGNNN